MGEVASNTTHAASDLLQRSLGGIRGQHDVVGTLAALSRDELQDALVELVGVVDEFVRRVADHNAISERAVLRSMGIEPDG